MVNIITNHLSFTPLTSLSSYALNNIKSASVREALSRHEQNKNSSRVARYRRTSTSRRPFQLHSPLPFLCTRTFERRVLTIGPRRRYAGPPVREGKTERVRWEVSRGFSRVETRSRGSRITFGIWIRHPSSSGRCVRGFHDVYVYIDFFLSFQSHLKVFLYVLMTWFRRLCYINELWSKTTIVALKSYRIKR